MTELDSMLPPVLFKTGKIAAIMSFIKLVLKFSFDKIAIFNSSWTVIFQLVHTLNKLIVQYCVIACEMLTAADWDVFVVGAIMSSPRRMAAFVNVLFGTSTYDFIQHYLTSSRAMAPTDRFSNAPV